MQPETVHLNDHQLFMRYANRIAALAAVLFGVNGAAAQSPLSVKSSAPSLVVFITIDQMRADYFARFGSQLTGGLKRLHDGGAFFAQGFQDHGITETAPGHASVMSGRFPVHTGIVMNSQGVNQRGTPLIGASDVGASPVRFIGTTLTDWMRAANPTMRVLSASRKDRGAILPIGRVKADVYWYAPSNGTFTTSRYYADTLPTWVQHFNARKIVQSHIGAAWTPLRESFAYPEPDSVAIENGGHDYYFPHQFKDSSATRAFVEFPWMDEMTAAFVLAGAREMQLGESRSRTDLLAVSFSTLDAIGHRYGPDSKELHDHILRLDVMLGAFLDSLDVRVGKGRYVVALTGDHGMSPYPTLKSPNYPNGGAKIVSVETIWQNFLSRVKALGVDSTALAFEDGVVFLNKPELFAKAGVNADSAFTGLGAEIFRLQGVQSADLITKIAKADTVHDKIARRWLHMFTTDGPARLIVSLTPYSYWQSKTYATHGSPNDADANVPILFWGVGVKSGQYSTMVRTVDMAPTLAAILHIKPLEPIDGHVLKQVVR